MNLLSIILATTCLSTAAVNPSSQLTVQDNVIYCGESQFVKLTDFEVRYTLPTDDITKGEKTFMDAFADRSKTFEVAENGFFEKETQSSMAVTSTKEGIKIDVKSPLDIFSEYGVCLPINFMGKSKSGGWTKQYLLNNVFRSTDGKILYAYLTNPSGDNVCIAMLNNIAGWREEYSSFGSGHFFEKLNLYANFDRAYEPRTRENEVSFMIMSVKDYDDALDKLAKLLDKPFLDVDRTGGKLGNKIKVISHGKTDAIKIVNELTNTEKTIPFTDEIQVEYESDTYLYPIRYAKGKEIIGGEAEIYGYKDIIDTYRKTMDKISLPRVFHRKNLEFDGNVCEHQCWISAGLRFLTKYGDRMDAQEKDKLTAQLKAVLDIITESDPEYAIYLITILSSPQEKYPAYHVFGEDRLQNQTFAMTIFLDAYKYFGEQKYYDYLVNSTDCLLDTYQRENGGLVRMDGEDYSTVTALIIPIIDAANFLKDKDPERYAKYRDCATKLAWHICKRGLYFPTEGGGTGDPDEMEMEDGSISCSALSLLYYCKNIEYVPEFIEEAKIILDAHESWVIQSSSCGSKCSSLRWWETGWEGDQNGPAICAGHAWTIWRAEADWLYYKLTGDKKYYVKAFNGFMTNISKIRPDGKTFAIRNIDMIPGGGFTTNAAKVSRQLQNKFPGTYDCGLSRYMWIRANDSILDELIAGE